MLAFGSVTACGGSQVSWDVGDGSASTFTIDGGGAPNNSNGGAGCGTPCTTDQQCQSNCRSSTTAVYCCDLSTSIGGMGLCYSPSAPATTCPAQPGVDAGRARVDAGVDAGRRRGG